VGSVGGFCGFGGWVNPLAGIPWRFHCGVGVLAFCWVARWGSCCWGGGFWLVVDPPGWFLSLVVAACSDPLLFLVWAFFLGGPLWHPLGCGVWGPEDPLVALVDPTVPRGVDPWGGCGLVSVWEDSTGLGLGGGGIPLVQIPLAGSIIIHYLACWAVSGSWACGVAGHGGGFAVCCCYPIVCVGCCGRVLRWGCPLVCFGGVIHLLGGAFGLDPWGVGLLSAGGCVGSVLLSGLLSVLLWVCSCRSTSSVLVCVLGSGCGFWVGCL